MLHKEWLCFYWNHYTKEAHLGLAQMYVDDSRFRAYYDAVAPGCAAFFTRRPADFLRVTGGSRRVFRVNENAAARHTKREGGDDMDAPKMHVTCGIDTCQYHRNHMCFADSIEVNSNNKANTTSETHCYTFKKKDK